MTTLSKSRTNCGTLLATVWREGAVAVVTGASSGLGRAIARVFAEQGASVALIPLQSAYCASPEPVYAVGLWYQDFSRTTDEEVRELLVAAQHEHERLELGPSERAERP